MASIINASTAGIGGLVTTADNSGILTLQTAAITALTIDAAQNVGIGTSGPAEKLSVNGAIQAKSGTVSGFNANHVGYTFISDNDSGMFNSADGILSLASNGSDVLTISSGKVGIGTSSPSQQLSVAGIIESTTGGVKYPDGTIQTTASVMIGNGGTTITGSVTLTSSSAASMTVTSSTPGLYATLPSATTCTKGSVLFSIYNNGEFDYGIKNNSGTQIGWVLPKTGCIIGLSDNSTTAGVWTNENLCKIGITANKQLSFASISGVEIQELDVNRSLILFKTTALYGIVYDASSLTWGNATLIKNAAVTDCATILISTNSTLLVSGSNTSTAMEAVVLTTSGTTITVNTAVAINLAGNFGYFSTHQLNGIFAVGSSYVFSYNRATNVTGIRSITVSGTVPTVGAEYFPTSGAGTGRSFLFVSGTIVRLLVQSSVSVSFVCTPYSVSGTTLTVGTGQQVACSIAYNCKVFQNENGNIVVVGVQSVNLIGAIFKLTGTTETVSTTVIGGTPSHSLISSAEIFSISASKTCVFMGNFSSNSWSANILFDTSGTAGAGTSLTGLLETGGGNVGLVSTTTINTMKVFIKATNGTLMTFDCSGTSPVLTSSTLILGSSTVTYYTYPYNTGISANTRQSTTLIIGDTAILSGANAGVSVDTIISNNSIHLISPSNFKASSLSINGKNNNASWGYVTSQTGTSIYIAEGAA